MGVQMAVVDRRAAHRRPGGRGGRDGVRRHGLGGVRRTGLHRGRAGRLAPAACRGSGTSVRPSWVPRGMTGSSLLLARLLRRLGLRCPADVAALTAVERRMRLIVRSRTPRNRRPCAVTCPWRQPHAARGGDARRGAARRRGERQAEVIGSATVANSSSERSRRSLTWPGRVMVYMRPSREWIGVRVAAGHDRLLGEPRVGVRRREVVRHHDVHRVHRPSSTVYSVTHSPACSSRSCPGSGSRRGRSRRSSRRAPAGRWRPRAPAARAARCRSRRRRARSRRPPATRSVRWVRGRTGSPSGRRRGRAAGPPRSRDAPGPRRTAGRARSSSRPARRRRAWPGSSRGPRWTPRPSMMSRFSNGIAARCARCSAASVLRRVGRAVRHPMRGQVGVEVELARRTTRRAPSPRQVIGLVRRPPPRSAGSRRCCGAQGVPRPRAGSAARRRRRPAARVTIFAISAPAATAPPSAPSAASLPGSDGPILYLPGPAAASVSASVDVADRELDAAAHGHQAALPVVRRGDSHRARRPRAAPPGTRSR